MKVLVVSTPIFQLGKKGCHGYAGLEHLAWQRATGMAAKGHQVSLVAPDGSECPGVEIIPIGPERSCDEKTAYSKYWKELKNFDVILDDTWCKWSYLGKAEQWLTAPVLGFFHAPIQTMYQVWPPHFPGMPPIEKACPVCISHDQAKTFDVIHGKEAKVAYNGCFDENTLLTLENGDRERIASYVHRNGRDRVLAWSEQGGNYLFAEVQQVMSFLPSNNYAIEICVDKQERTLISTPDNPIMTRYGWKAAHLITCHDEVLYAEHVDLSGGRICPEVLWQEASQGNAFGDREDGVCNQWESEKTRHAENEGNNQDGLDGPGDFHHQGEFLQGIRARDKGDAPKAYHSIHTKQGESFRAEEIKNISQTVSSGSEQVDTDHFFTGGVSSWTDRRRRACIDKSRYEKEHSLSSFRDSEYRQENSEVCVGNYAGAYYRGGTREYCTEDSESETLLSNDHNGVCGWGSSKANRSVHDCQEEKSRETDRILRHSSEQSNRFCDHGETNRTISKDQNGEFQIWKKVVSVRRVPTPARVFDLKTSTGNFVANGVVVHNCDLSFYQPMSVPRTKRFLFLARFSTIKSPHLSIEVAKKCDVGLDLVGDTSITNEPDYLNHCKNMCDGRQIKMLGGASRGNCVFYFSSAYALLHVTPQFREPFGLSPVESMACGTPVIGWKLGAIKETLVDGETGYIVNSMEEYAQRVCELRDMPPARMKQMREACRERAKEFSLDKMINRVEELAIEACDTGGW